MQAAARVYTCSVLERSPNGGEEKIVSYNGNAATLILGANERKRASGKLRVVVVGEAEA